MTRPVLLVLAIAALLVVRWWSAALADARLMLAPVEEYEYTPMAAWAPPAWRNRGT